jgi:hypothetical protein
MTPCVVKKIWRKLKLGLANLLPAEKIIDDACAGWASNPVGNPDLASVRFALSCVFSSGRRLPDGDSTLE